MPLMRGEIQRGEETNCYCPVCQPSGESSDKRLYYKYVDGKLLAHCKHGCSFEDIAQFFPKSDGREADNWVFIREHIYYKPSGEIFGRKQIYRVDGKKRPLWQRYENGEYITGLEGQKANLYNLPALMANEQDTVWITEGEKDADTLTAAGLLATSPPNGAGYWTAKFNGYFDRRHVIIIQDNDEAGKKHLERVAKNLTKVAKSVRLIDLTDLVPELKPSGDVTDVFAELPDAKDRLLQLATEVSSEQTRNTQVCYISNEEGKPLRTRDNFNIMLSHYGITIKNSSVSGIEYSGKLPKMSDENRDNVMATYLYSLGRETEINFTEKEIGNYIMSAADENIYNPIKEWLATLDTSVKGYIREYFNCLRFDKDEEPNKGMYLRFFGKWLVQSIAMQHNEIDRTSVV
jgi:5S rRNA maturation endonuclease (ribonuclease M5)